MCLKRATVFLCLTRTATTPPPHHHPTSDFYQINTCGAPLPLLFPPLSPPPQPAPPTGPPTDAFSDVSNPKIPVSFFLYFHIFSPIFDWGHCGKTLSNSWVEIFAQSNKILKNCGRRPPQSRIESKINNNKKKTKRQCQKSKKRRKVQVLRSQRQDEQGGGGGGRQVKREVKEREVMMVEKERCEKSRTDAALTSMYWSSRNGRVAAAAAGGGGERRWCWKDVARNWRYIPTGWGRKDATTDTHSENLPDR